MAETKAERVDTVYVVGEWIDRATVTPPDTDGGPRERKNARVFVPVLDSPGGNLKQFTAPNGDKAIEQHTGTGKDAKPGRWKAIAWTAWKGVVEVEQVVKDERTRTDDE